MTDTLKPWLLPYAQKLMCYVTSPLQALCITGPEGVGHDELALWFAAHLMDTNTPKLHPDFLSVANEDGKSIGIDAVRDISKFVEISPTLLSRKVVLVPAVDTMTRAAQQAFLKTLEEPVVKTVFILLCTQPNKLLPTVHSRCQHINISSVSYAQAKPWLDASSIDISEKDYALTDGAPLLIEKETFKERMSAYTMLLELIHKKITSDAVLLTLKKHNPMHVLAGMYYAMMHGQAFSALDQCIALRKKMTENPQLNWDMQLSSLLRWVEHHAS